MEVYTSIKIRDSTKNLLRKRGEMGDSYDSVIRMVMGVPPAKKNKRGRGV